jgi:hypothetical protein
MRIIRQQMLVIFLILCCCASRAQEGLRVVSVADLSQNPLKFDGHFVSVRAWLEFGWEGDNFLLDRLEPSHRNTNRPRVWLYCDSEHERQIYGAANSPGRQPVLATFTGYFHFVPSKKARMKDVFDPGSLQLEAIRVSDHKIKDSSPLNVRVSASLMLNKVTYSPGGKSDPAMDSYVCIPLGTKLGAPSDVVLWPATLQ